ncbi:hypothetical protein HPB49_014203 [Dermacentor silvarum]|uniref:Uncharacterized protein n=1 Tax=Dermacentor silvarum TaxID=543639 RepID=A0ACB8E0X7_DERSI|nr:hypothetical protein HPB49_014203 [Dermacentor silvarum]
MGQDTAGSARHAAGAKMKRGSHQRGCKAFAQRRRPQRAGLSVCRQRDLLSKDVDQGDLLGCLVQHKNDFRMKEDQRCRAALEHFQLEENIKLDPKLDAACVSDQRNLCGNVHPGEGAMLECLKEHKNKLTRECHIAIFQRERLEAESVGLDYSLTLACKSALRQFCPEVIQCLKAQFVRHQLTKTCEPVVMGIVRDAALDYQLDPVLARACSSEVCMPFVLLA